MVGLLLLTVGGLLSLVHPARRHVAWMRWSASLHLSYPVAEPSPSLSELADQATAALRRQR